jgi:hypothetical protein
VKHGGSVGRQAAGCQITPEDLLVLVVGNLTTRQIRELGPIRQIVHDQDIGAVPGIETFHQVAADETGPARDDDHAVSILCDRIMEP